MWQQKPTMSYPPLSPHHTEEMRAFLRQLREKASRISLEHVAWIEAFATTREGASLLHILAHNSPYLSHVLLKETLFFQQMMTEGFDSCFSRLMEECRAVPFLCRMEEMMHMLRFFKQKTALLVAIADIMGVWELEKITRSLSVFAAIAVNNCVNTLLGIAAKNGEIQPEDISNPAENSGLIVLAVGKLGSWELNYSSDIDLVVFFDSEKARYTGRQTMQHFFVRLARDLVHMMQDRNSHGYVFRTDLRLRPDPGSTPLAVSVLAAESYYESVGQNWERAAMIKARFIAGDIEAGERFLYNTIRPFIWRKHLDFAAIEDIRSIKRQIESRNNQTTADLAGYNIKIGHGGIREIEFFVQTQQLIWGGRDRSLRVAPTCEVLHALASAKHITPETADTLAAIYRYYRTLEHRLQMVADQQTHSLPTTESGLSDIAIFMGAESRDTFLQDLREKLTTVKTYYRALYPSSPSLGADGHNLVFTGIENDPETVKALIAMGFSDGEMVASLIRGWHHGRYSSTKTQRARELITELVPKILKAMARTANPDMAFLKFDNFLSRLPDSIPLFSLFYANAPVLNLVAELMGSYPYLAENLSRRPALLDYVLSPDFLGPLSSVTLLRSELEQQMGYAASYDEMLDIARLWTHEHQFQVGVQLIQRVIPPKQARLALSDIAETVLNVCFHKTQDAFARQHGYVEGGQFAIIAMGKLGSRNLSFRSDIDLVLVYDVPEGESYSNGKDPLSIVQYYTRLSRKFIHSFTALTPEGTLYAVDMRLRPSGDDGALCTRFKTLDGYFDGTAATWEYMALTRARVIVAEPAFAARINQLIQSKLIRTRERHRLAADILDVRRRIAQTHIPASRWRVKYAQGGVIDVEFIAQFLQLAHASHTPEILSTDTVAVFAACGEHRILSEEAARDLQEAALFLFDIQSILRLAYEGKLTDGVKDVLTATLKQENVAAIEARLLFVQEQVRRYFMLVISG